MSGAIGRSPPHIEKRYSGYIKVTSQISKVFQIQYTVSQILAAMAYVPSLGPSLVLDNHITQNTIILYTSGYTSTTHSLQPSNVWQVATSYQSQSISIFCMLVTLL